MPLATPHQYAAMLDAAADGGYVYAAIKVTSCETLNAALRGFNLAKVGRNRSDLGGRRRVPVRDGTARRPPECTRVGALRPCDRRGEPHPRLPAH